MTCGNALFIINLAMKKLFALIATLALTATAAFAGNGVRIINMDLVIKNFSKTEPALAALKVDAELLAAQEKDANEELLKEQKDLQALIKQLDDPTKSEKAKADIRKEAEEKSRALLAKRDEFLKSLQEVRASIEQKKQASLNEILKEIAPVVEKYAKDNNFDAVLDITSRVVVYYKDELDITAAISAELEKIYPHEEPVAPAVK